MLENKNVWRECFCPFLLQNLLGKLKNIMIVYDQLLNIKYFLAYKILEFERNLGFK